MEDSPHASSPSKSAAPGSSGWGWGWSTSTLSVISDLQKAAAEAAEEISKNALAAAKRAAKGVTELQNSVTSSLEQDAKDKAGDVSSAGGNTESLESDSAEEFRRRSALGKLEEASEDSLLGHGLKVIDNSVENLASGAWQALGTAWKGSIDLVQKLEHSAENLAGNLQKQGSFTHKAGSLAPSLIESGKAFTAKGIKVLEYVGKETMDLIASETGIHIEEDVKQSDKEVVEEDDHFTEDVTFDRCFYIYGGPEQLEELEALSNHYTLLCNRAKTKLPVDQKLSYDQVLKQLQQILTLSMDKDDTQQEIDKGKRVETGSLGDGNEMRVLRDSSVNKAAEMAAGFTAALGGLAVAEIVHRTADRLEAIRAEGVHRLSELCALGVSHLLALGKSVLSSGSVDQVDESIAGIDWPNDCAEKAKLIRVRAQAMAGDIGAVSDSFITGIGDVTAAFQAAIKSDLILKGGEGSRQELLRESSVEDKAHAISSDLEQDGSTAIEKLQDGLQHLLFIILSTSMN